MNAGQYEGLLQVLQEIRDRLPEPVRGEPMIKVPTRNIPTVIDPLRAVKQQGANHALIRMRAAATGWARTSFENQDGSRDQILVDQQPFVLSDILRMIDDVARELGLERKTS